MVNRLLRVAKCRWCGSTGVDGGSTFPERSGLQGGGDKQDRARLPESLRAAPSRGGTLDASAPLERYRAGELGTERNAALGRRNAARVEANGLAAVAVRVPAI